MSFIFRWKHKDGSIVEFCEKGWRAEDPENNAWLSKMSGRCGPSPVLTRTIKIWLQKNCKPVDFRGSDELSFLTDCPVKRRSELERSVKVASPPNKSVSSLPNESSRSGRGSKGKTMATKRSIDTACDEFFRSRGMQLTESFNPWRRLHSTDGPED
jgi:hypothetical protein